MQAGQRRRMVAPDVRDQQRRAERKAVRRDDRDDVQRDDDGVGAHTVQDAPRPPPENSPDFCLLEREDERAALAAALNGAGLRAGQRAGGDRQDALLEEPATRAVRVLRARGSELERSFAFGGVQQLFAHVEVPYSGAAAHAAGAFSVGGEPDHAVLHGLYWLTAGLGPLAIVVDDAHWLDVPSLRWLAYMVNRVADLPLALLIAARSDEQDELLTRIALHPSTTVLEPSRSRPRPWPSWRATSAPRRSTRPPAASRSTCTRWSPPRTPRRAPWSSRSRCAWRRCRPPACASPARSPSPAAAGRSPRGSPGLDVRDTVEAAEALAKADILVGDGFAHPLVQQAVYAAIPAAERAELHAHAAASSAAPSGSPRT